MIDGKYGTLEDKETNAFNGMIGMVQRQVKRNMCSVTPEQRPLQG